MRVPISRTRVSLSERFCRAVARLEASSVARAQNFLAIIADENHFTRQHINELILFGVPVALARPGPGRQAQEVDAELRQAHRVAKPPSLPHPAWLIEWRGIERPDDGRDRNEIDALFHDLHRMSSEPFGQV